MDKAAKQRLFFALWPDERTHERLATLVPNESEARCVRRDDLHVTLAFLGSLEQRARSCVEQAAARATVAPFTLRLDEIGYWRRPRVLWVGASHLPPPLAQLLARLNAGLCACGFEAQRRDYRAHVTLARKAHPPIAAGRIYPIAWTVDRFSLVESRTIAPRAS